MVNINLKKKNNKESTFETFFFFFDNSRYDKVTSNITFY